MSIKITDIREGSIKLTVKGSQKDIERLVYRIKLGELAEVNGLPIEDVQIMGESSDDDESTEFDDKWRLVWEIVNQVSEGRDLRSADLRGVNLRGAYLKDADLRSADLRDSNLICTNLRGADLRDANMRGADLRGVDLRDANLRGANVENALFGANSEIFGSMKHDLIRGGAIFEDSPGDRSLTTAEH